MKSTVSADGTPVSYEQYGSGPPLVLVHGSLSDHETNWFAVRPLLEQKFTVFAIDRRGRGATPEARGHQIEREFEDVASVVRVAGGPVCLLGHSYGAQCALGAASQVPDLVTKVVLYEPPWPTAMKADVLAYLEQAAARGDWDEVVYAFLRDAVGVPIAELDGLKADEFWGTLLADAKPSMDDWRALIRYDFDPEVFRSLTVPVLLLVGTESPRENYVTDALASVLPDCQIVELAGQAHEATTTAPDLFVEKVAAFLST